MRSSAILILVPIALALAGCTTPTVECTLSSECEAPEVCVESRCVAPADGGADVPGSDSGVSDAGRDAPISADGGIDAGTDAGSADAGASDTGLPDAPADAGTDAGTDAGPPACTPTLTWGVVDDSTTDAYGDHFGRHTLEPVICDMPALGDTLDLHFRAHITAMGTEFPYDFFGTYVAINGIGDYRDTLMSWTYVTVSGTAYAEYVLRLPADIDRDGRVDWVVGRNTLEISTWSDYNARPSRTGVDALWLVP